MTGRIITSVWVYKSQILYRTHFSKFQLNFNQSKGNSLKYGPVFNSRETQPGPPLPRIYNGHLQSQLLRLVGVIYQVHRKRAGRPILGSLGQKAPGQRPTLLEEGDGYSESPSWSPGSQETAAAPTAAENIWDDECWHQLSPINHRSIKISGIFKYLWCFYYHDQH